MSKATPEAVQAVFHAESLRDEVAYLNSLLDDSHLTTSALLQLLRDHNIHVGSTELIKAREKVEAEREALKLKVLELSADAARVRCSHKSKEKLRPDEIEALRTANAGLVERVRALEEKLETHSWSVSQSESEDRIDHLQAEVRQLSNLRERAEERVRRLEEAGDRMAIYAELGGVPLKFVGVVNAWREAKGQA